MLVPSAETDLVSDFRRYTYHLHLHYLNITRYSADQNGPVLNKIAPYPHASY